MEELYDHVRLVHQNDSQDVTYDVQHEALVPVLRLYQSQAVNWMLRREKYRNTAPKGSFLTRENLGARKVKTWKQADVFASLTRDRNVQLHSF